MPARPARATLPFGLAAGLAGALLPPLVLAGGVASASVAATLALALAWALPRGGELPPLVVRPGLPLAAGVAAAAAAEGTGWSPVLVVPSLVVPAAALGLAGRQGRRAAALGAGLAVLGVVAVLLALAPAPPWTALVPGWAHPGGWLPGAIVLGVLLATLAALLGEGPGHARRHPGVVGAGLVVLLVGLTVAVALAWEAGPPGLGAKLPYGASAAGLATALALLGVASVPQVTPAPRAAALETVAWATWFAVAGPAAVAWTLHLVIPLGLAALLAARASTRPEGLVAGAAAVACGIAGAAAFPGVPSTAPAAALAALTIVALAWRLGWPSLRAEAA